MVRAWLRGADLVLARLERLGLPWWAVTAAAYVMGYEIAAYLNQER